MGKWNINIRILVAVLLALVSYDGYGQCHTVYDFYGTPSATPIWYSCTGDPFSFNLQSPQNWGAYEVNWGDGTPNTTGASWSTPSIINHVYAAAVETYTMTITETATGCTITGTVVMEESSSASIQIPVGGLTQACAPQMMEFINSSTNVSENTIFTWDFGDGSPQLTFDYTNWNQVISHVYQQGTVNCETEVSLTASNYCNVIQGGESEATFNPIRIWDLDDPGITASATLLCYPDTTVTFTNTTYRNCFFQGNIYQRYEYWNFGDYWGLGHDSIIDWTPWPPTFPHTMHYPGIGTYTVQLLDSNYCGIAPTSITIQIVPPPSAGFTASTDTTCVGQNVTFFQQATGSPNAYWWDFGTGAGWVPTGSGNITHAYNTPGTYIVRSRVAITGSSSACDDIATMTIVVLPNPTVTITTSDNEDCVQVNADMFANSVNAVAWQWTFDVAPFTFNGQDPPNIVFTGNGNHTVTVVVTSANGCQASANQNIRVRPRPNANFSITNLCEGETAHFNNESTITGGGSGNTINSWQWNFGDGATSTQQNPDHQYATNGNFVVTLVSSTNFCSDTIQQTITVDPKPVAVVGQDVLDGCSPLTVHFTNASLNADTYQWTFGDGGSSALAEPTHTFTNITNANVTYTVVFRAYNAFGCMDTDTLYVTVYAGALAAFTDNGTPPGCSPFLGTFTNQSINASSYFWDFGDGATSTLTNPTHVFTNTTGFLQSIPVTLIAYHANGCHDTLVDPILIYPQPNFAFDLSSFDGCSPVTVAMPYIAGAQSYAWDFGDGTTSTFPMPVHTFSNSTSAAVDYTVTLVGLSPFGCSDTASSVITVFPRPLAQFNTSVSNGCSPLNVNFTNGSIGGNTYLWNFGDGTTSTLASPNHVYTNTTASVITYTITLTVTSAQGCMHQTTRTVDVYPSVVAAFADPGPQCSPATVFFNNQSALGLNYSWDFGNGFQSIDANPSSMFTAQNNASTTYTIQLMVTSPFGCTDTHSANLVIHPQAIAAFSLSSATVCDPTPATITNLSQGAATYQWNYDDGTFSNTADNVHTHQFQSQGLNVGTYDVTLTATSSFGCSSTATQVFTVYPSVTAQFTVDTVGCSPFQTPFFNQSIGANTYEWHFGDGAFSGLANPSHLYTIGTTDASFEAWLVAYNQYGCVDSTMRTIYVNHQPIAGFTLNDPALCNPLPAEMTNTSQFADSYNWNFGDGTSSTSLDVAVSHAYPAASTNLEMYNIILTAWTNAGCSDTTNLVFTSYPPVNAAFNVDTIGCTPFNASFIQQSSGASNYAWNFGDGSVSTAPAPQHLYTTVGSNDISYEVDLVVSNQYGCTDSTSRTVYVKHTPIAALQLTDPQVCDPAPAELNNLSQFADNYSWSYGDGTFSANDEVVHTHTYPTPSGTPDVYNITLTASTIFGCSDEVTSVFTVYPGVTANFATDTMGCSPFNNAFMNQSVGATSFEWSFGDGALSSETNPSHQYLTNNTDDVTFEVQLIASNIYGCTDSISRTIYVNHTPLAVAQIDTTAGCYPLDVTFFNGSIGADTYVWNYGNGQTSNTAEAYHNYIYYNAAPIGMTYDITLTAIANNGCMGVDDLDILVSPDITADFDVDAEGCSPLPVYFDNQSDGGSNYFWTFGDGDVSNEQEPAHTFFNNTNAPIAYEVMLVIQNQYGCTDTTTRLVTVHPAINASFDATPIEQVWPNATVTLDNTSTGGAPAYAWRFDDETTSNLAEPGTHTYATWGEYTIELVAGNNACSDTAYRTITILPPPPVGAFTGPAEGCAPLTVQFTNESQYAAQSNWQFGDGGVANATSPVYTYWNPGTYTVTLTVTGFDGSSDVVTQEQIIHVYPRAQAAFTIAPNEVNIPSEPIFCVNLSQNATTYEWLFGDGNSSNAQSPSYYYQEAGLYDVTLIANNQYNCPDTMHVPAAVQAKLGGLIDFPNAFTPDPNDANGGYYDPLGYNNNVFFPMHAGVTEYNLQIFNKWGELLFESTDVNRGWDGYYRNQMCKQDVYVWKVRARFVDGQRYERAGDVTLLIR